jgi:hypothetical protein
VPSLAAPTASHTPDPAVPPARTAPTDLPALGEATLSALGPSGATTPEEERLTVEIERLWTKHSAAQASFEKNNEEHTKTQSSFRKSRAELKDTRDRLSKLLHELKPLISRPGRGGGWSRFLMTKKIPRATADSLVRAHKKTLNSEGKNCSAEQITEPPETAIRRYLQGLWPRLSRVVTTRESVELFIAVLRETAEKSFAANGESSNSPAGEDLSADPP